MKEKKKVNLAIQPMSGMRMPKTWVYLIGDGKKEFIDWSEKIAKEYSGKTISCLDPDQIDSYYTFIDGHPPGDHYIVLISPGSIIYKDTMDVIKNDNRFVIKKYYKNSELPKILSDEL